MLDEQHPDAELAVHAADERRPARCFSARLVPAAGSSRSSSCGLGAEGAGDLQPALVPVGERAGQLVGPVG